MANRYALTDCVAFFRTLWNRIGASTVTASKADCAVGALSIEWTTRPMPMFYFHVFNDFDSRDEEGQELPSLDAAREVAISECRILAAESVEEGHLDLAHRIDVHDKDDSLLFSVSFGDAVRIDAS